MTALLFAGPSLAGWDGALPEGIDLRPPAAAGDIWAAIHTQPPPTAIGLVDGVFGIAPSVWHKEILDALDRGIAVVGAASIGALRAAELHGFGMIGIGAVFEAYSGGRLLRDDAVLVAHAPAALGYRPLSVALVDFEDAVCSAPLPADVREALVRRARRMSFEERDVAAICRAVDRSAADKWCAVIEPRLTPGLKQRDALALIECLRSAVRPRAMPPRLVRTGYYRVFEGWAAGSAARPA